MSAFFRFSGRVLALVLACLVSIIGPVLIMMTHSSHTEIVSHTTFPKQKYSYDEPARDPDDGVVYRGAQTRVMYNRVGKCGSRATLTLLEAVAGRNNFTLVLSDIHNQRELSLPEQIDLVNYINQLPPPFLYSRHMFYIDFQRLGAGPLVHINVIRDPLSRFISSYYYRRFGDGREHNSNFQGDKEQTIDECMERNHHECSSPKRMFYVIPFFCGQEEACREPSSWALEKAKANVRDKYLVVGILEEYEDTLRVLEKLLPIYFKGIVDILRNPDPETKMRLETMSTKHKTPPNEHNTRLLRFRMQTEYEFYYFVRDRFHQLKHQLGI
ncbi:uronyl 2-sulfotransferase-like [Corticium candelabrum]|uniref:uronyl 2-sulfotransferase-like n=1 Tax=Corticium candelabrum TaxID=121492 RepID=UPI002E26B15D|nr:uronyl 2-sulfotransferase-like [Corticium candelabrum]